MAGLGEACSHVASLLFYVDAFQRTKEATTCTQEQCKWLLPKAVKEVPYLPVAEIDFKGAIRKMQDFNFGNKSKEESHGPVKKKKMENACCTVQDKKQKEFLNKISLCGTRPAILSIAEPFNAGFVPFGAISNLYLPELYSPSNTGCSFDVIQRKCAEVVLPVLSEEQLQRIQRETAKQSKSKLWFRLRSGRITASRFKQACSTDVCNPSKSLIKAICYPTECIFTSNAVAWGLEMESIAVAAYVKAMEAEHKDFQFFKAGLILNNKWPFLGASPDGLICCKCCGEGVLEVKCPYSCREISLNEYAFKADSMLVPLCRSFALKHEHQYYFQVQCQLAMSGAKYAHFVVWTPKETYTETIYPNKSFFDVNVSKAEKFFQLCVLPELLGKYYTKQ